MLYGVVSIGPTGPLAERRPTTGVKPLPRTNLRLRAHSLSTPHFDNTLIYSILLINFPNITHGVRSSRTGIGNDSSSSSLVGCSRLSILAAVALRRSEQAPDPDPAQ